MYYVTVEKTCIWKACCKTVIRCARYCEIIFKMTNFKFSSSSIIFALSNFEENITHAMVEIVLTMTILQILD